MEEITLNSLQHFVYCPHEWGLMTIGGEWAENAYTVGGHLFHERVHDGRLDESRPDKFAVRGMPLFEENLGLVGVADLVEFTASEKGCYTARNGKRYRPAAIEYKVGRYVDSKSILEADKMQLAAQIVCLNSMLGCECDGYIFYKRINRRIKLTDFEACRLKLEKILERMRGYLRSGTIPSEKTTMRCNSCALKDICLPKTSSRDVYSAIENEWSSAYEKTS